MVLYKRRADAHAADARDRLEGAYFELQQGRGASFPTVAVGSGNTVHLKTLQQISGTGVTRDVVPRVDSNPQQYRWYRCEGRRADVVWGRRPGQARGRLPAPAERRRPDVSDYVDRGRLQGVAEGDAADLGDGHQAGCGERATGPTGPLVVLGYRGHGSVYDADETERLEAAYASDQLEVAVGDRTIDLQRMQRRRRRAGNMQIREKLPQEYRWSCAGDELTPYNNEARAKLEDAYAAFGQGRGPTYSTVSAGDCEVSLKTMTSRHARTGVQRDVVRELEHDRPVVPPPDNTLAREASSVKLQAAQGRPRRGRPACARRWRRRASRRPSAAASCARSDGPSRPASGRRRASSSSSVVGRPARARASRRQSSRRRRTPPPKRRPPPSRPPPSTTSRRPTRLPRAPATLTRAEGVRSAEAEWRKARDVIRAIPHAHAPMSRYSASPSSARRRSGTRPAGTRRRRTRARAPEAEDEEEAARRGGSIRRRL